MSIRVHAALKGLFFLLLLAVAPSPALAQSLSVTDATVYEGDSGTFQVTLQVELSTPVASPVTVHFATANGTATAGSDYVAVNTTVTIPANTLRKAVDITVKSDTASEPDETILVNLSNAVNASIADSQAVVTLLSDDASLSVNDVTLVEGASGSKYFIFNVALSNPSTKTITFDLATADGTAVSGNGTSSGADFYPDSGTNYAFTPGQTLQTFAITVYGDPVVEGDESFQFNVTNVTNATVVDGNAVGTILNDDTGPATVSVHNVTLTEGNSGTKNANFTVQLSSPQAGPVSFDIATSNQTATAGSDYVAKSQLGMQIPAGATTQTFSVVVNGDTVNESDETFKVTLSNPVGVALGYAIATGKILNDDLVPLLLSIPDSFTGEGSDGWRDAVMVVQLSRTTDVDVTFDIETSDGTATAGSDYTHTKSVGVVIPAGQISALFSFPVNGDKEKEADETIKATLSNVQNAPWSSTPGSLTLWNDDQGGPTLTVSDANVTEGNFGTKEMTFTASLSETSSVPVSFTFSNSSGVSAQPGSDYMGTNGTVVEIPAGTTSKTFSFTINGDTIGEPDETFSVWIDNIQNATMVQAQMPTGTILNDDPVPSLSVSDVTVNESANEVRVTVALSEPAVSPIFFDIASANGTATSGSDYGALQSNVQIQPGDTHATFPISIAADSAVEPDEAFTVNLSNANGATIADGQATVTIANDDGTVGPRLSIADLTIDEGNSGTKLANLTVSLSAPQAGPVTFNIATADLSAIAGSDYVAKSTTGMQIPAGSTSATFAVTIMGDVLFEGPDEFLVNLSNAIGVAIGDGQAVVRIESDDASSPAPPTMSISDASVTEGQSGAKSMNFVVSLSSPLAYSSHFDFATADGTAVSGSDYDSMVGYTFTMAAGQTSKVISVNVRGDTAVEPNETFTAIVSNAPDVVIGDGTGTGTIVNDDGLPLPSLTIADVSITEGNSGTKAATFTVSLSAAAIDTVSFDVATANGSATAGSDYVALALSGQSIAAGETSKSFAVTIKGDSAIECDENFTVVLSNVVGATVSDGSAVGTIVGDDLGTVPAISISDASAVEGTPGIATFTVSLSGPACSVVSYNIATANGSAVAGSDYAATSLAGQIIPTGATSKTFSVAILDDKSVESVESFAVNLSSVAGAWILDGQATGTITDGNSLPKTLSVSDAFLSEGSSGTSKMTFTVRLSSAAAGPVSYDISTGTGTAQPGSDFVAKALVGETIPAGSTSRTFTVDIVGDTVVEGDQTFPVTVSNVVGATLGDGQAVGTIHEGAGMHPSDEPVLSIARFDAGDLVDDIDDGNRAPLLSIDEYALLLHETAAQLCGRTNAATLVAVDGVENRAVLADLAEAANAQCATQPHYVAVMANRGNRGFLAQVPTSTDVPGVQVLGAPTTDARSGLSGLSVLAAGHAQPLTLLSAMLPTAPRARTAALQALGQGVTQRLARDPQARLVLIGGLTVPSLIDLTARDFGKAVLPTERMLLSPALLDEFDASRVEFPIRPAAEAPAQVLQLQR